MNPLRQKMKEELAATDIRTDRRTPGCSLYLGDKTIEETFHHLKRNTETRYYNADIYIEISVKCINCISCGFKV